MSLHDAFVLGVWGSLFAVLTVVFGGIGSFIAIFTSWPAWVIWLAAVILALGFTLGIYLLQRT